jgi:hypothetical protein
MPGKGKPSPTWPRRCRPCPWTMRMWVLVGTRFSSDTIMAELNRMQSLGWLAGRSAVPCACPWHGLWPNPNGSSCCCWVLARSNQDAPLSLSLSSFQLWSCAGRCISTWRHCSSSLTGASILLHVHGNVSRSFQHSEQVLSALPSRSYSVSNWELWSSDVC